MDIKFKMFLKVKMIDSLANLSEYEKTIRKNGFRVERFIVHKCAKYRRTR